MTDEQARTALDALADHDDAIYKWFLSAAGSSRMKKKFMDADGYIFFERWNGMPGRPTGDEIKLAAVLTGCVQPEGESFKVSDAVQGEAAKRNNASISEMMKLPITRFGGDDLSAQIAKHKLQEEEDRWRTIDMLRDTEMLKQSAKDAEARRNAEIAHDVAEQRSARVSLIRLAVGSLVVLLFLTAGAFVPAWFGVTDLWGFWNGSMMAQIGGGIFVTLFTAAFAYLFVEYVRQKPRK